MTFNPSLSFSLFSTMLCLCLAAPCGAAPSAKSATSRQPSLESMLPSPDMPKNRLGSGSICPTVMSVGQDLVLAAQDYQGIRYRAGGSSPRTGFDCSGFVYWVFARQGVSVPRDTAGQASSGREVSRAAMLPGDIIVFKGIRSTSSGMHSAIYVGGGRFIHSPNSRSRVRIESLSQSYWASHPYTVRRVLKAPPCDMDLFASTDLANTHNVITGLDDGMPAVE